jgi:hypothetical protein
MAVGFPTKVTYADGDVYSAADVNDTNGTINLLTSSTLSVAAGKNAVINGGMDIWQRGTSISVAASTVPYTADRWTLATNANQASTVSRQATGDTTNLPTIQYCARVQRNSGQTGTTQMGFTNNFETVNSLRFAGQTVTISFYARKGANYSPTSSVLTVYGISGTGTDQTRAPGTYTNEAYWVNNQTATLTTTWQRFTFSGTVSSTANQLAVYFGMTPTGTAGANDYFEVTGVQLELGATATTFSRAQGTIQGELAACQRYYYRMGGDQNYNPIRAVGNTSSTSTAYFNVIHLITMRVPPTTVDYSTLSISLFGAAAVAITNLTLPANLNGKSATIILVEGVGFPAANTVQFMTTNNSTSGYLGFSAEL